VKRFGTWYVVILSQLIIDKKSLSDGISIEEPLLRVNHYLNTNENVTRRMSMRLGRILKQVSFVREEKKN
jgi:hypothetical protein